MTVTEKTVQEDNRTQECVLITGITGFIGGHLASELLNRGCEVHAIIRPSSLLSNVPKSLRESVTFHVHDATHSLLNLLDNISSKKNIDVVYHLAARYVAANSYEDIGGLVKDNIEFGTELLEAMKANNINHFVNTGTAAQHYENEAYNPMNLYAATKQAFADILQYYQMAHGVKTITLQLFDTYGPGSKRRKVLDLFKEISQSGDVLPMSPGEQLIDLVHIDDVVNAFLLAGDYLCKGEYEKCGMYGVSSGAPISLRQLAERFAEISGKRLRIQWGGRPYRERESMIPWKEFTFLPGWRARVSLEMGIKELLAQK